MNSELKFSFIIFYTALEMKYSPHSGLSYLLAFQLSMYFDPDYVQFLVKSNFGSHQTLMCANLTGPLKVMTQHR
mgnify:CR=1 FL=1